MSKIILLIAIMLLTPQICLSEIERTQKVNIKIDPYVAHPKTDYDHISIINDSGDKLEIKLDSIQKMSYEDRQLLLMFKILPYSKTTDEVASYLIQKYGYKDE